MNNYLIGNMENVAIMGLKAAHEAAKVALKFAFCGEIHARYHLDTQGWQRSVPLIAQELRQSQGSPDSTGFKGATHKAIQREYHRILDNMQHIEDGVQSIQP
ncbi:hypothetical protein [Convivina praedatoris]|uniref:Uncharacterized protein n=1 Tax=Convivina praedatoris TaxID=2880963 RepID=A0ABN8HIE3_9LACO|nr:hypothetical protein [Convivina sp. LMG 32447]CAH1856904.1 hypothetical protein R077815_01493 [Convivina sp. LMG 32447]CAH1857180.1 hypothetical protein R078138_01525 [Convivina sp. LMG 32447]CAH1857410.1 hypothetical protein LMG032447_01525 [Convivina sp. LMG 32447]